SDDEIYSLANRGSSPELASAIAATSRHDNPVRTRTAAPHRLSPSQWRPMNLPQAAKARPEAMKHLLARFPIQEMAEGDQYITNDPWLASGHLHDLTVAAPVLRDGRVAGWCGCGCHQADIGGFGQGPDARSI